MATPKRGLILASASPQRRKLLRSMGLRFKIVPSRVSEPNVGKDWPRLVKGLALRKARAVAKRHPQSLVVGADTVVVCNGKLLLKPRDKAHAKRILGALNGRWHRVYTGVALVCREAGLEKSQSVVSRCKARRLEDEALERFAGRHMDKSGAYAVQDKKDPFIAKVVGPIDNVVGFPRQAFRRMLSAAKLSCALLALSSLARAQSPLSAAAGGVEGLRDPWGLVPADAAAAPELPYATVPEAGPDQSARIARLKDVLPRLGLEPRGGGAWLGWKGEADMKDAKLAAFLDELDYLSRLGEADNRRKGSDNGLSDRDRHRLGCRWFQPALAELQIKITEEGSTVSLTGPGGRLDRGPLDLYLRALERARAAGAALPAYRSLELAVADSTGTWSPARLEAKKGEFLSIELGNDRASAGAPAGFHLEGYVAFREVPYSASQDVSFLADKAGSFAYFDPAFPERGQGSLSILEK